VACVKAWLYQQAVAPTQTKLNPSASYTCRCRLLLHDHRFHKVRFPRLAQALLPVVKLRCTQTTLTTKRRYTLTTPSLLGNEPPPTPPCCFFTLSHTSTIEERKFPRKMHFTQRSRNISLFLKGNIINFI
jgi:hypothetical protein